jgi:hypothetical protein
MLQSNPRERERAGIQNSYEAYSNTELSGPINMDAVMRHEFNAVGLFQPKMPEAEKGINSYAYQ